MTSEVQRKQVLQSHGVERQAEGTNLCVGFVLQTKREDLRSSVLKPFVFSSFSFLLSFSFQ